MESDDEEQRAGVSYAFGQLARVLTGAGRNAAERATQWRSVIAGMLGGTLQVGSRVPTGAPPWVTLDVVHGGFATGGHLAGGPLRPHEVAILGTLPKRDARTPRAQLNAHYLDHVQTELVETLRSGCYRIDVPEEAALLAIAWLVSQADDDRAAALFETIAPYFAQLRFYPRPAPEPLAHFAGVHVETTADVADRLKAQWLSPAVEAQREAVTIWAPLYDDTVRLFLETVDGEPPRLRRMDSSTTVIGGLPCRRFADDWNARAAEVLASYKRARAKHTRCRKPDAPRENYCRLRGYLAACLNDRSGLSPKDVASIQYILAAYVEKHGLPGTVEHAMRRATQHAHAALPSHRAVALVVANRLSDVPEDEGCPDIEARLRPIDAADAHNLPVGTAIPARVGHRARRCWETDGSTLIAHGLINSSEALARTVPRTTARALASAIVDDSLRRLYWSTYTAFRRRRSLLLLNLESQVRFGELPWVGALAPWLGDTTARAEINRAVLVQTARLAITSFPYTLLPNAMVREPRTVASAAQLAVPFVDELAADIFMGKFAPNFVRSAMRAAKRLRGTLYARYYGLPYDRILRLDENDTGTFAEICSALIGREQKGSVASNGQMIEQAQIATTHNLLPLLDLIGDEFTRELPDLAARCFDWICRQQRRPYPDTLTRIRAYKNCAYAWRQMILYLTLRSDAEHLSFVARCEAAARNTHAGPLRRWCEAYVSRSKAAASTCWAKTLRRRVFDGSAGPPRGARAKRLACLGVLLWAGPGS